MAVVPVVIGVLIFTSPYHNLYRFNFRIDLTYGFSGLIFSTGPLYPVFIGYILINDLISLALLFSSAFRRRQSFGNALLIGLGILFPLVAGILYALGLSPIRGFDLGSVMLVFTGIFIIAGVFGGRYLDVAYIARDLVMDNIDDLVIVVDSGQHITDMNMAARNTIGLSGKRYSSNLSTLPAPWADFFIKYSEMSVRRQEVTLDINSDRHVYDLTITPIKDERRKQWGSLFLMHEITDSKKIEDELRESEEKFRRLVETSVSGMYIYDGKKIVVFNSAFQQITGYSGKELAELDPMDVIHPIHREMVRKRFIARMKNDIVPQRYEVMILTPDREEKWADLSVGVIHYRGEPATLGTFYDITERKRLEEK